MRPVVRQLLKTVVASQAAFWLDFGVLALLTEVAGLHYLVSAAIAFLAGTSAQLRAQRGLGVRHPSRHFEDRGVRAVRAGGRGRAWR